MNSYLKSNGVNYKSGKSGIREKYDNDVAKLYGKIVKAKSLGLPVPTKLDASEVVTLRCSSNAPLHVGDERGMERLENESESDYIKRQNRLKEEARERMRLKFGGEGMGGFLVESNAD